MTEQDQQSEEKETQAQEKRVKPTAAVPGFLNISLACWKLMIVIAAALTAFFSWSNGLELLMITFRTGTVILCLGALAWLTNWILNRSLLEAYYRQREQNQTSEMTQ
jgi:hypothetical protein